MDQILSDINLQLYHDYRKPLKRDIFYFEVTYS